MNRVKKILASIALTFGIMLGATVVAPVVTAESAQAVTLSSCYSYYEYGWKYTKVCYHNYSWWEEVWGWKDGWYRLPDGSYA